MNRRDFIKTTVLGVFATFVPISVLAEEPIRISYASPLAKAQEKDKLSAS